MAVLRFDPFSDFDAITKQLLGMSGDTSRVPRFMPVDLFRAGDHYVLLADLPGVDPGSVDVSVHEGTLTLTAERTARSDEGVQWLTSERFGGKFRRQLSLGEGIDTERISASYDNGVLTVTIPVAERAKPRKIEVLSSSEGTTPSIEASA
ncbi:Hsp20/alpha crystallin family protein [Desertihabitans aurantiacus]|uniref:Hsp20/alpha crystallin family protein n=1 Tax=Desertihabitans aurantiacus TaxID=2282477 RepID=UPI001E405C27|nr:Hsp20/alpha crystallin family protein [Desertihabitans aurantiacus]